MSDPQELKSVRKSLQECVEDDKTGLGSGSRLVLILTAGAFALSLLVLVYAHAFWDAKTSDSIKALAAFMALGGGAPYTIKQVFGKNIGLPDSDAGKPGPDPQ